MITRTLDGRRALGIWQPNATGLQLLYFYHISETLGFDQMAFSLGETVAVCGSQNCDITAAAICWNWVEILGWMGRAMEHHTDTDTLWHTDFQPY